MMAMKVMGRATGKEVRMPTTKSCRPHHLHLMGDGSLLTTKTHPQVKPYPLRTPTMMMKGGRSFANVNMRDHASSDSDSALTILRRTLEELSNRGGNSPMQGRRNRFHHHVEDVLAAALDAGVSGTASIGGREAKPAPMTAVMDRHITTVITMDEVMATLDADDAFSS